MSTSLSSQDLSRLKAPFEYFEWHRPSAKLWTGLCRRTPHNRFCGRGLVKLNSRSHALTQDKWLLHCITWEWEKCKCVTVIILAHHSPLSLWKEWMRLALHCLPLSQKVVGRWVRLRLEESTLIYIQEKIIALPQWWKKTV